MKTFAELPQKPLFTVKANLSDINFHTLRHTFGSRAVETTGNIAAVGKIMGHSDLKTTMRYVHLDQSLHDAVESVSNFNSIINEI